MSRAIEFNVWDKINEVMTLNAHIFDTFNEKIARPNEYDVLQYTGLKDSKGVKIFEGDIVKNIQADSNRVHSAFGTWCYANFHAEALPLFDHQFPNSDESSHEVIGNIYENGDLLDD